jgi:3-oxoacyl-[acyl-carrier protein] reductase
MSEVYLVTGATGSIGFEIAAQAAESGIGVAVHGRTQQSSDAAIAKLQDRVPNGEFLAVPADFLVEGDIVRMVEATDSHFGRIDAVLNCAVSAPPGITGRFRDTDPSRYTELCTHGIATLQQLCHAALPALSRQGGAIVPFAADSGRFAAPGQSMVGATRAAIMNFTRNLALEISREKVRINCVSPSFIEDSAIFDKLVAVGNSRPEKARQRAGLGLPRPADVAQLGLFLCGPGSRHITGQVISINGGLNA